MSRAVLTRSVGVIAAGTCLVCGYVSAVRDDTRRTRTLTCPGCNTRVRVDYVKGVTNDREPCDDQCQYARRNVCSCSCGGANHRAGYIQPPEMIPVLIRERDAAAHAAKVVRKDAKDSAARAHAAKVATDGRAALLAGHPELAALETDRYAGADDGFVLNMRRALRDGRMSPAMVTATLKMLRRDAERDAAKTARDAAAADAVARGVAVPTGRVTFTGTITRVMFEPGAGGWSWQGRSHTRMCVRHPDGWEVWGTMPDDIRRQVLYGPLFEEACNRGLEPRTRVIEGRRVRLTATTKPGNRTPVVGGFSRPTGAVLDPDDTDAGTVVRPVPTARPRRGRCPYHGGDTICPDCEPEQMAEINARRDAVAASWVAHPAAPDAAAPDPSGDALSPDEYSPW